MNKDRPDISRPDEADAEAEAEAFLDYLEEALAEMPPVAPPTGVERFLIYLVPGLVHAMVPDGNPLRCLYWLTGAIVLYSLVVPGLVLHCIYIKRARKILDQHYPRNE